MKELKTSLYESHKKIGAKIVPFAGYLMPVNYSEGIKSEYESVRNNVGMFDVSHMGFISIEGAKSSDFLNYVSINNVNKIISGSAQYSVLCNQNGGSVDDVIIYKKSDSSYFMIVNASNIKKDFDWLSKNNLNDVNIINKSDKYSIIAIQGPNSRKKIINTLNLDLDDLGFYNFSVQKYLNNEIIISRTGYTGELGFEIIATHEITKTIWDTLLNVNVAPCGLGVRDILRIEMKYCLYGHELNEDINPIQAGLSWVLDKKKNNYIGEDSILSELKKSSRRLICFKMIDRAIPRTNYKVILDNNIIGYVSSGGYSISLNQGIGLAFIDAQFISESEIFIEIRNKLFKAITVKPPFIDNYSLHS